MKASTLGMALTALLCPLSWASAQISYNYVQANVAVTSSDTSLGSGLDGAAMTIGGYYELLDYLHLFGSYTAGELDDEPLETSEFRVGFGLDFDFSPRQSVYFDLAALSIDTDLTTPLGVESSNIDGYGASIGYRERNQTRLEFTVSLDYADYADIDETDTSLSASLQYELNRRWRLEGGVSFGGDVEAWRFGARYYFRPAGNTR
jgi:hypothetical protein